MGFSANKVEAFYGQASEVAQHHFCCNLLICNLSSTWEPQPTKLKGRGASYTPPLVRVNNKALEEYVGWEISMWPFLEN